jgi:DNA-binding MarR family transcriptional regulator
VNDTAATDPTALARDLRESLRPLWRRFTAHKTLSASKTAILFQLEQHGELAATELASAVRVTHQAIAAALRDMEDLSLVSRSPDPGDRRRTLVEITETGRRALESERAAGQPWLVRAVEGLDDDERATLAAAIPLLLRLDSGDRA